MPAIGKKWWLPSALAAAAGIIEVTAAAYARSAIWTAFGIVWLWIAVIYYSRARP